MRDDGAGRRRVASMVFLGLFACSVFERAPAFDDRVGPLVGSVTHETAELWAWAGPDQGVRLVCWPRSRPDDLLEFAANSDPEHHDVLRLRLHGLEADTEYDYSLVRTNGIDPQASGSFRTAPPPGAPCRFRLALASCMSTTDKQSAWYLLLAQHPSLLLLLGDNVYADSTDADELFRQHLAMRSLEEFAGVVRNVPTLATWDDHDFAGDDSDGTARGKAASLAVFRDLWPNPGAGRPGVPGVFFRASWGDVDLFVLDGRYHRSPNSDPDSPQKTMLGAEQRAWLLGELEASTAPFKLVASGSTFAASQSDGWARFPTERDGLLAAMRERGIEGVVWLSGDLHRSKVEVHAVEDRLGYPLYEVISSGITRGDPRSFATLDLDTTLEDPELRVRILLADNTVPQELSIRASQLRH